MRKEHAHYHGNRVFTFVVGDIHILLHVIMNIWNSIIEESRKKDVSSASEDTTFLFTGSKKAGKTTAIYRFLNRNESPKPTMALEYTFGRQSRSNALSKDVCHIWELGGGTLFANLLQIPLKEISIERTSIFIVVDLSLPNELLITLTTLIELIRTRINDVVDNAEKGSDLKSKLTKAALERLASDGLDHSSINPFLVPLTIIGGKYDVFQNFEPEQRKIICRMLRYVAHTNGASLQFFSSRMENLINRTRAVLSNLAFGTTVSHFISQDYNKPLVIPAGADSIQQIGANVKEFTSSWKAEFEKHFPQSLKGTILPEDPAKDPNFKEPVIDNLRAQKDDEFERYKKQLLMDEAAEFAD